MSKNVLINCGWKIIYQECITKHIAQVLIRSLYEINQTSKIKVETPVGKTSSITVEEGVKQGTIFEPITIYAS